MRSCPITWNGQLLASALLADLPACVDAYIADRQAAGQPVPDRQAAIDRLWALAQNVTPPGNAGGINSAESNRFLVLTDKAEAPWFGASTAADDPGGAPVVDAAGGGA